MLMRGGRNGSFLSGPEKLDKTKNSNFNYFMLENLKAPWLKRALAIRVCGFKSREAICGPRLS